MSTTTTNLGLVKPDYSDTADVQEINQNMDKIDGASGGIMKSIAIVANGNTHAAIASGQYVYVRNHGTLSEGLYRASSAIAANGALSNSNLTADTTGGLNALKSNVDTVNSGLSKRIPTITATSAQLIQSGENFNSFKTGGVYVVTTDAIASTISNIPRAASGRLIVIPVFSDNSNYIQQYYIPSTVANVVYVRKFHSSLSSTPWTPWIQMANYIVDAGTVITSAGGTSPLVNTYNTNEYACVSIFTTAAVTGCLLLPYKYGDAANGRWGLQALNSYSLTVRANESVSYVAILMPYAV